MSRLFPRHGDAWIIPSDHPGIVHLHMQGPWNIELVQYSDQLIDGQVATLPSARPWALLVDIGQSGLCTPEALRSMRQHAQNNMQTTYRVATAWVLPQDLDGQLVLRFAFSETYAGLGAMRIFTTIEEALPWLQQCLDDASDTPPG